ncbi:MAG TPA: pyruvoyl-dependent arginine decarboxylase [Williamwhitmania sp.]|nr:pyruvoyl-dependent arginine decarboxylase [Williamwhitmania sp.]
MTERTTTLNSFSTTTEVKKESQGILVGNRIPKDYFETGGIGESDIAIHAGSYHLALKAANIEMANIMTYSSILPRIATKIERPATIEHGAVIESIMSTCTANKGERASAGIVYGWLYNKKTGQKFGGLVCEHYGNYELVELKSLLRSSLDELYFNGFSDDYRLEDIHFLTESFIPQKKYGTALVALCFTSYYYPILKAS